jgi:GT2 family glycosyltransferase
MNLRQYFKPTLKRATSSFSTVIEDKLPAITLLGEQRKPFTETIPYGDIPIALAKGVCIRFCLTPSSEVITGLRLRFGTYCRTNQCHITVRFNELTHSFHASYLIDNEYVDIPLPTQQMCTAGQPIELEIFSEDANEENQVALWCTRKLPDFVNTLTLNPLQLPEVQQPLVSIVIPVFNKALYTYNCLLTVQACDQEVSKEVIIINNASSDKTGELLNQLHGAYQVINNSENQGFVKACRQGAAVARGELILFLNNDTQVMSGWLSNMVNVMAAHAEIGITGSKLIYPDGRLQEAGGIIFNDASGCNYGRLQEPTLPKFNQSREVDYCSGASLMIRKTLWQQLNGFDMRYAPAYYEDTDLCFAARRAGYKVFYCHDSEVIHHEGITAGTDITSGYKAFQAINRKKFQAKWWNILSTHPSPQTSFDVAAFRFAKTTPLTAFRIPEHKIVATHLVGQGWAANFWSYLNLNQIDAELDLIQSVGFNTVILLIPWMGFQIQIDPIRYYEEYFTLLKQLLNKLQGRGLQVILRLGYNHDNGPSSQSDEFLEQSLHIINQNVENVAFPDFLKEKADTFAEQEKTDTFAYKLNNPSFARQFLIGANSVILNAWCDYLDRLWEIAQSYSNVLGGFICWEDFFFIELIDFSSESERIFLAEHTGYQQYLEEHYSLEEISVHYKRTFSAYTEVPIPAKKSSAIHLFSEFWDKLLVETIFKISKKHFPPLTMEVRTDCEPQETSYICHNKTFDLTSDTDITTIYYSPAWGASNNGQSESATAVLKRIPFLFEYLRTQTNNALFIDQFNFIDNTPGFELHSDISLEQIPQFLSEVVPILQSQTIGYGLWTLHDVRANALKNGLFERDYPCWEFHNGEIVFDADSLKKAALLNAKGTLSQLLSWCVGIPYVENSPFQLDFKVKSAMQRDTTETVSLVIFVIKNDEVLYEKHISVEIENNWLAIHLEKIPFYLGHELKIENLGAPVLLTDFYLYQRWQENGIIDANGKPKAFYQHLVSLNQQLNPQQRPLKSFFQPPDFIPEIWEGLFVDRWIGKTLLGLIAKPSEPEKLTWVIKVYVPDSWQDYQNYFTLTLDDKHYPINQAIKPGYNEMLIAELENHWFNDIVFFRLEAETVSSPNEYDAQIDDHRKVSMQLIELGFLVSLN